MPPENVEVIRRIYDALEADDLDALFRELDPEIEWVQPPDSPSGEVVHRGYEGVRRSWHGWRAHFEDYELTASEFTEVGERVFVRARQRGGVHGVEIEQDLFGLWELRGGKATRLRMFNNERTAREAAGLSA